MKLQDDASELISLMKTYKFLGTLPKSERLDKLIAQFDVYLNPSQGSISQTGAKTTDTFNWRLYSLFLESKLTKDSSKLDALSKEFREQQAKLS